MADEKPEDAAPEPAPRKLTPEAQRALAEHSVSIIGGAAFFPAGADACGSERPTAD